MLKYLVDIELAFGTWPYECHIATQYVVELGRLVQMVCTDETACLCQTGIVVTPLWLSRGPNFSASRHMERNL